MTQNPLSREQMRAFDEFRREILITSSPAGDAVRSAWITHVEHIATDVFGADHVAFAKPGMADRMVVVVVTAPGARAQEREDLIKEFDRRFQEAIPNSPTAESAAYKNERDHVWECFAQFEDGKFASALLEVKSWMTNKEGEFMPKLPALEGNEPPKVKRRDDEGDRDEYRGGRDWQTSHRDNQEGSDEESGGRERKSYGLDGQERPERDRGYGDRERRPYGDRDRGGYGGGRDRKPYGDRDRGGYGGDRGGGGYRGGGDRDRKPYGDRDRGGSGGGGYRGGGDRDRKPYGDRDRGGSGGYGGSDRKPYGDRENKPYGDRDRGDRGGSDNGPSRYESLKGRIESIKESSPKKIVGSKKKRPSSKSSD